MIVLSVIESTRLMMSYSAVMDNTAVKAPGPAYMGNAKGTNEPVPSRPSFLKIVTSSVQMTDKYSVFEKIMGYL